MELDWIIQQPIDFEYKQYLILDYVKKAEEKLERIELYPTFQELSLLYSSAQRVVDHGQFITLKREPEEVDDEILIIDLIYNTIRVKDDEEGKEIVKCAEYASEKFKDLFMIAKSLWSIVNESISLEITNDMKRADGGWGYFYFIYKDELFVYQYNIGLIVPNSEQNKCNIQLLYQGPEKTVEEIIVEKGIFGLNKELEAKEYGLDFPIFKISFDQNFPLEGSLISLSKRKVMNYVFQSVRIKDLKDN
jgi:hypothetical protein